MKGIILAGGTGTRMYPISLCYSKQLVMIYDKPMIYYPLSTLMLAGIREILIISDKETIPLYQRLFGDGNHLGLKIEYKVQTAPNGIAEAFIIGKDFIGNDSVTLILGDNIFYGKLDFLREALNTNKGATIFGYYVNDPQRYGVVEFDDNGKVISIEEKPPEPKSNYAVVGLYVYNNDVIEISENLKPSKRGELEITDVNIEYFKRNQLDIKVIGRGIAWLDTGTPQALLDVSSFIGAIEKRQGLKVACIEEVAYMMNYINLNQLKEIINKLPNSDYRNYLETVEQNELIYKQYQA
ncbi:MAG TPA: glucose-1-phosphate thymidylyltransferase RfbA [Bacteroidales bacterium]|nr:glucose-1-phosphate thymidylyltransferase RfbA [Bacteroidales bacterium]